MTAIATTAFEDIYGDDVNPIKITLPTDNMYRGKEMTAFGGLKSTEEIPQIDPYIYLGGDPNFDISQVNNVVEEDGALRENIAISIAENVCQLEKNIEELLSKLKMPMRNISSAVGEHRTTLIKAAKDVRYINTRSVVSTLFFAPAQQLIFNIESKL